jgi:hypothetical protein
MPNLLTVPVALATVPENFERFKECEVYHCHWAMLAEVSESSFGAVRSVHVSDLMCD